MASGLSIRHKKEFHPKRWLFLTLFIIFLLTTLWFVYRWYVFGEKPPLVPLPASALTDVSVDESKLSNKDLSNHKVNATQPRYLSISAIGLEKVRIFSVGLTKYNVLEIPNNINDVGWYKESAIPGQGYGAVLLDGHGEGVSSNGSFVNLAKLTLGDKITIERGDGKKISYKVVENRTESIKDANTSGMKRLLTPYDKNKEGLGMIGPSGNWIPRDKVFSQKVLVRAVAI